MDNQRLQLSEEPKARSENQKSKLLSFVESLFANQGKQLMSGVAIEMGDGNILVVSLREKELGKIVEVIINHTIMGQFEPYTYQGYQYVFKQRYRVNMRKGLTQAELFMEDVCSCYKDIVLINKAYH